MKVEIWSDVMCPFCYIGKRKFEEALNRFEQRDKVEVVWKSFQLNPQLQTDTNKNLTEYLAETKGWSLDQTRQIQQQVVDMAKKVGLHYDFDKAVVANSFDAHRLIQFAKANGRGDAAEEALFKAYFEDGKNTADKETLLAIGLEIGLDTHALTTVLDSEAFANEVHQDEYEARQIGLRGVPHFVFNDRYAVSGAQESDTFLGALQKSVGEWQSQQMDNTGNLSCDVDGNC